MTRKPDYVILSGGGSLVKPGSVSPEGEALLMAWIDRLVRERDA